MRIGDDAFQLHLYKKHGTWVFDDLEMGLIEEPLILGMTEMIDHLVAPAERATIRFSPGDGESGRVLLREEPHEDGYFYRLKGTEMRGWLCPATLHYYPEGHPEALTFSIVGR